MEPTKLPRLLTLHFNRCLPASERQELFSLINRPENKEEVLRILDELLHRNGQPAEQLPENSSENILLIILQTRQPDISN